MVNLTEHIMVGLTIILAVGITAQWISWRLGIPSILLLLILGIVIGPMTGLLNPDVFFDKLLFPFVSLSVAIILFEGGLTLKFDELKDVGSVVLKLIIIGIPVTLILAAFFAYYILGFSFSFSLLFASILVVTGPTVILPILRQVKPNSNINSILKWEGIINDPIGALIAILVFEAILTTGMGDATLSAGVGLLITIFISSTLGIVGAYATIMLIKRDLVPEYLQNGVALSLALLVFVISNLFQKESGLFAVTIMGIIISNNKKVVITHIVEFKENLRIILISVLFIILAARIDFESIKVLGISSIIFVLLLIIVVRPLAVYISTMRSSLTNKEKIFISAMAPRGIVAAAVSALFALELIEEGMTEAAVLVPLTFVIIIVTISVYGLSAVPLAKYLQLSKPNAQGCLIVGASQLSRMIGKALTDIGFNVLILDTNWQNISTARMEGINTHFGSATSDDTVDEIDYYGLGQILSMTSNDEVNSLASLNFSKVFGIKNVYQLTPIEFKESDGNNLARRLRGKYLFGPTYNFTYLDNLIKEGFVVKTTNITAEYNLEEMKRQYNRSEIISLFVISETNLTPLTDDVEVSLKPGEILLSLINPN